MKNIQIVGIDVSKNTLDCNIFSSNHWFVVENNPKGFSGLLQECKNILKTEMKNVFFCFENTGRYSKPLSIFLYDCGFRFKIVNALDLKRSLGLTRGKSDKKDARLIAKYAWEKRDQLSPTKIPSALNDQLRALLSLREKLMRHRTSYKNTINAYQDCYSEGEYDFIKEGHSRMISRLTEEIKLVEDRIINIFKDRQHIDKNYQLLLSIKGIGKILAIYMIVLTENFTRFDDYRKFACYAGIAPFPYESGTSVKGKSRLSHCANKQIKSLLNMASMASIQLRGEFKTYYLRRTEEGKNKMSTLNIIRNKLVSRAFAVVKRGTPYVDLSLFAA